jgi:hypothetical protein
VQPPGLVTGKWYCVELMLDGGTPTPSAAGATGALDYWVDSVEMGPSTHLWMRSVSSLRVDALYVSLFHHDGTHSAEGVFYDDIVVSTSRIGCR